MYAVIETGGKQYKVASGDIISVERLAGNAGDTVTFKTVLAVGGKKPVIGAPHVDKATVTAEILDQERADKIIVFKKKRRQNYRRKAGHQQQLTKAKITDIKVG